MDFAGKLEHDESLSTSNPMPGTASSCDNGRRSWSSLEDLEPIWARRHHEDSNTPTGLGRMVTTSLGKSSSSQVLKGNHCEDHPIR